MEIMNGLKFRITSTELCEHLKQRSAYHARRRDKKKEILPGLIEANEKLKANTQPNNIANKSGYGFTGENALDSLKADINEHNNKSLTFAFLAGHLFDVIYSLDHNDLIKLELLR